MSDRVWYFAYGSNMQPATFAGRRGIAPSRALAARASGWRLVLDKPPLVPIGESFANLVATIGAEVYGVAYEITMEDLAQLDLTEGVLIGNYARVEIAVAPLACAAPRTGADAPPAGAGPSRAFTLVSEQRAPALRPSDRYMALLVEGAQHHGLPDDWIAMLRGVPTRAAGAEVADARAIIDAGLAAARRRRP
ncbi:MAG: gamma-glutamylcyclotransferase [Deltaproteobacteria bacterium]|nr:gamma-glutamylcyclotransferase [Deltaproteobacteria bacterium]